MPIDLRKDAADIRDMLEKSVKQYAAKNVHAQAGPHHGPVSAVGIGYDAGTGAHVRLHFDVRPDYEPDGTYTHNSFAELPRPEWEKAYESLQVRDLDFILPDGSRRTLKTGTDDGAYVTVYGEMLVGLLKDARASGLFAPLPKQPRCELGVEEVEGMFGWPVYEDRGKENSL
jgi:hypothetical protein